MFTNTNAIHLFNKRRRALFTPAPRGSQRWGPSREHTQPMQ